MLFPKALDLYRPKRPRTTFTSQQLSELEKVFQRNPYLIGDERTKLAEKLNLSDTQVPLCKTYVCWCTKSIKRPLNSWSYWDAVAQPAQPLQVLLTWTVCLQSLLDVLTTYHTTFSRVGRVTVFLEIPFGDTWCSPVVRKDVVTTLSWTPPIWEKVVIKITETFQAHSAPSLRHRLHIFSLHVLSITVYIFSSALMCRTRMSTHWYWRGR